MYNEYALSGTSFACTVHIPSHTTPFGGSHIAFPNKKAARSNAAQEAMQYIIGQGLTDSYGNVKTKKKTKSGTAVTVDDNGSGGLKSATTAQKVNGRSYYSNMQSQYK